MENCASCQWWGKSRKGCCDFVDTMGATLPAKRFEVEAYAQDDTDLAAYLVTGPDFGCIHHAAKDAEP